jgi:hypothetical protein
MDSDGRFGRSAMVPEPPTNDWERAYEAYVRREEEIAKATPGYSFATFSLNMRGLLLAAGLIAVAVALIGRALGVGGMSLYWIACGTFLVVGTFTWWQRSQHGRRR